MLVGDGYSFALYMVVWLWHQIQSPDAFHHEKRIFYEYREERKPHD